MIPIRDLALLFYILFIISAALISYIDFRSMKIPNKILFFQLTIGVLLVFINPFVPFISSLLGASFGFFFPLILCIINDKFKYGSGDIKYQGIIGLFLGFNYTLYVIAAANLLNSLILLLLNKKYGPLAPMLSFCSLICIFFIFNSTF